MDRHSPIIALEYVSATLMYAQHLGIELKDIQSAAAVDLSNLSVRQEPFSLAEVLRLAQACIALTKIPHYGLANGNYIGLSCHGMASLTAMHRATYAEYLETSCRLCNLLFPPLTMHYFETKQHVGLRIYECLSLAPCTQYFMEWIMANFYNVFHFLLGAEYKPEYIAFPYQRPGYHSDYQRYLQCAVYFDVEHAEFAVDKQLAQKPLPLADARIANTAAEHFYDAFPSDEQEILRQVRELLAQNIEAQLTLEEVAEQLELTTRTLRRRLRKAGTTYLDIVDELRREAAISQLLYSNRPIVDVAASLNFCDTASFSKAFKRWTGKAPRVFRSTQSNTTHSGSAKNPFN